MPVDYYSLTDSQQKKLSEIRKSIKRNENVIDTEKQIKEQAPDTYVVSRARKSVNYHKSLLEKYEREYILKIEEHKRAIAEAEATLLQEQNRESRNIIIAKNNIKKLREELDSLGLPQVEESTLTQPVEVSKPIKQSKDKEPTVSFQEFIASGFDEEEELARSRKARGLIVDVPPPPQEIEETPQEEEQPSYNQSIFVQQSYSDRPPTITNTKKPLKQVPNYPIRSITSI